MPSYTLKNNILILKKGALLGVVCTLGACNLFKAAPRDQQSLGTEKPQPTASVVTVTTPKPKPSLVDTVYWINDVLATPSITTPSVYEKPASVPSSYATTVTSKAVTPAKPKFGYNLALLLPFYTERLTETSLTYTEKAQFALDFYAGVKLAADSLSARGVVLTVSVLDSKMDYNTVLNSPEMGQADFILGPVERDNLLPTLDFARQNDKTLLSPYVPLGELDTNYARYIQVKPSLQTHCESITQHIRKRYKPEQVVLVGRTLENETARFPYFQTANSALNITEGRSGAFEEWAIEDETNLDFSPYMQPSGTTVLVLPSWNEAFVGRFLEALNASPFKNNVVVYGMPQWTDYKTLTPYYEALKVRLSSSTFIETTNPAVKEFRSKFFAQYGKMPNADVFLGYDCMLYFGQLIGVYGKDMAFNVANEPQKVLHTSFDFKPVFEPYTDPVSGEVKQTVVKFENKYINILKFQGNGFKLD